MIGDCLRYLTCEMPARDNWVSNGNLSFPALILCEFLPNASAVVFLRQDDDSLGAQMGTNNYDRPAPTPTAKGFLNSPISK